MKKIIFTGLMAVLMLALWALTAAVAEPLRQPVKATRVVDLTHEMHPKMAFWPGGIPFRMTRLVDYDKGFRAHQFTIGENTGTHVDAPAHFLRDRKTIDRLQPRDLVVPVIVIDVKARVGRDPDYRLSAVDVRTWESRYGQIAPHTFVITNTGWHKRFANPRAYINQEKKGHHAFSGVWRRCG